MTKNKYLLVSPDFPPPMIGGSLVYIKTLIENCDKDFDILTGLNESNEKESLEYPHKIIRSKFIVKSNNLNYPS